MARFIGFVSGGPIGPDGELVTVASSDIGQIPIAQQVRACERETMYLTGVVINESDVEVFLRFQGFNGTVLHQHTLKPYAKLTVKNLSVEYLGFVSLSIAEVHVMLQKWEVASMEQIASLPDVEFIDDQSDAPYRVFDQYTHTDIASATTTTIATPTTGQRLRVLQISVQSDAATIVTLQWTDSDGTSNVHIITKVQLTSAGTFIIPLGIDGLQCPNGTNGLLRAVSTNTANVDIDVIWFSDTNNQ